MSLGLMLIATYMLLGGSQFAKPHCRKTQLSRLEKIGSGGQEQPRSNDAHALSTVKRAVDRTAL